MYRSLLLVAIIVCSCDAMPRRKRSTWADAHRLVSTSNDVHGEMLHQILANEMFLYARESPEPGLSREQIRDFFLFIGKGEQMANNFSTDYIYWGDRDGDGKLNRNELLRAMEIHKITDYI